MGSYKRKLTDHEIDFIRQRMGELSVRQMAKQLKVSRPIVQRVVRSLIITQVSAPVKIEPMTTQLPKDFRP